MVKSRNLFSRYIKRQVKGKLGLTTAEKKQVDMKVEKKLEVMEAKGLDPEKVIVKDVAKNPEEAKEMAIQALKHGGVTNPVSTFLSLGKGAVSGLLGALMNPAIAATSLAALAAVGTDGVDFVKHQYERSDGVFDFAKSLTGARKKTYAESLMETAGSLGGLASSASSIWNSGLGSAAMNAWGSGIGQTLRGAVKAGAGLYGVPLPFL
jgi:hypothetical protein